MRILLVNGNYRDGSVGGTQSFTETLADSLTAAGCEVAVLCQAVEPGAPAGSVKGVGVYRVRPPRLRDRPGSAVTYLVNQTLAIHNPLVRRQVRSAVHDFRPDVAHVQMLRRLTPSALTEIAGLGVPLVHTVHELFSTWNFDAYQREDTPEKFYSRPGAVVRGFRRLHRTASRRAAAVVAPSRYILDAYLADGYFAGVPHAVVPNGVPMPFGDPCSLAEKRIAEAPGGDPTVHFLMMSRLDHHKGVQDVLSIIPRVTGDAHFHFAGEGVLSEQVRAFCEQSPRATFYGPLTGTARQQMWRDCDVVLAPSTWEEPFGLVLIEAYAAAMPVICTSVGAMPTIVDDGRSGIVVPPSAPTELLTAVQYLIDRPEKRHTMIRAAAAKAAEFTVEKMIASYLDVYRRTLANRQHRVVEMR
jgi:glycosyltransferase involved in cell wall biosynthesis